MSEDKSVRSSAADVTVKFVKGKVCELLRLHPQTWEESYAKEEFQILLKDFSENKSVIFFWSSTKGCVVASNKVWLDIMSHNIKIVQYIRRQPAYLCNTAICLQNKMLIVVDLA